MPRDGRFDGRGEEGGRRGGSGGGGEAKEGGAAVLDAEVDDGSLDEIGEALKEVKMV